MVKKVNKPFIYTSMLYLCGFFLFLEWLYPAVKIGDTGNFSVFIGYAVLCFLISLTQVRWYISFVLKGMGLLFAINYLFYYEAFIQKGWMKPFINEVLFNASRLMIQDWYNLTNIFRSILFLLLIWLMSYLIHYWFIEVKRILLFIILTFIYITVLDTFTAYDATWAIIRTFMLSFISLGMVNLYKTIIRETIQFKWLKHSPKWAIPLIMVVLLSTLIGFETPHHPPKWQDPVPFIISMATGNKYPSANPPIQKSGYGEDDSQLGGSFIQDNTPVFQAIASDKKYYRIETKDVYTGKGWERSTEPKEGYTNQPLNAFETFSENVITKSDFLEISYYENMQLNKIVYPYGINTVFTNDNVKINADEKSGMIQAFMDHESTPTKLSHYRVLFNDPVFDINMLKEDDNSGVYHTNQSYRQLPDDLPDRVHDLALEITAGHDNKYDKAKAIEQYFGQAGFVYQTSDVPVPEEDQDYVDQFLFETQAGYCDNYSTSMIVMLRSIDIPARWVKGFTGGEQVSEATETEDDSRYIYQITNENAHSWVEVYFEDVGWVPFEPTQGFSNQADFEELIDGQDVLEDNPAEEIEEEDIEDNEVMVPETNEEDPYQQTIETPNENKYLAKNLIDKWYIFAGILFVILLIAIVYLYRARYKIQTKYFFKKHKNQMDKDTYLNLYDHMLKLLSHKGLSIATNQTLREYAILVDQQYRTDEMNILTRIYEKVLYNDQIDDLENEELIDLFKRMSDRIMNNDSENDQSN